MTARVPMPALRRPPRTASTVLLSLAAAIICALFTSCSPPDPRPKVRAELHSWIVAGRGRHLYLELFPDPSNIAAPTAGKRPPRPIRIEFGSAAQRTDYQPPRDPTKAGRVARMTLGVILQPIISNPDNRLEAEYWLTPGQADALRRDRVFAAPYELVGRNSNAGMARALRDAGLSLPSRVAKGGGVLGEFPGIDLDVGKDIPQSRWAQFGIVARAVPPSLATPR